MKSIKKQPATSITESLNDKIVRFLGSKLFFWLIVLLFVLQALWLVFSFRYAMLYDESYHYNAIRFFAQTMNPLPVDQPQSFDVHGLMVYGNASLYHFLMAIPYKVITAVTSSFPIEIISLRILNVALATSAILVYRRLLVSLGVKDSIINAGLLVYTLIPLTSLLSATITYDNLVILLTGLFLLSGVNLIRHKKELKYLYLLVSIGILACLVKFTFTPVFLVSMLFLTFTLRSNFKRYVRLLKSLTKNRRGKIQVACAVISIMILCTLGVARYGTSIIKYRSIVPGCEAVIGSERCDKLGYYRMISESLRTKDERPAMSIDNYVFEWTNKMMTRFDTTGIQIPAQHGSFSVEFARKIPVQSLLITMGEIVIFFCSIFMLHRFIKDKRWRFIILAGSALTVVLFVFNIQSYYTVNENLNVQVRYLISFVPLILAFGLMSIDIMVRSRVAKVASLLVLLLLSTQGGGAIKHIVSMDNNWYWSNDIVTKVNKNAKKTLKPFIYEKPLKL